MQHVGYTLRVQQKYHAAAVDLGQGIVMDHASTEAVKNNILKTQVHTHILETFPFLVGCRPPDPPGNFSLPGGLRILETFPFLVGCRPPQLFVCVCVPYQFCLKLHVSSLRHFPPPPAWSRL